MLALVWTIIETLRSLLRNQRELALENLALRQQVAALIRTQGRQRLQLGMWTEPSVMLSQKWRCWRESLAIVEPETVIRWHREGFRGFWRRKSPRGRVGRPGLAPEVVSLIRKMAQANVTWGAPRIRNELAMVGI